MKVRGLTLRGFTNHRETTVRLPDAGIALVTGCNGSGKSSLLEAVAWCGWGRTIRGTPPGAAEGSSGALVALDGGEGGVTLERARKGRGRASLRWSVPGLPAVEYETPTKAQEALDAVIGDFERWRRTCVFTSTDAWSFAEATDRDRKLLLEGLLGLSRLDGALERCRGDLRAATRALDTAEREVAQVTGQEGEARHALAALEGVRPPEPVADVSLATGRAERLGRLLSDVDGEILAGRAAAETATRDLVRAEARATAASNTLVRLRGLGECPTCTQPVAPETVARLTAETEAAAKVLEAARAHQQAVVAETRAGLQVLEEDARDLREQLNAANQTARTAAAGAKAMLGWSTAMEAARARLAAAEAKLALARTAVALARVKVRRLQHAEGVLGLRGVRAQVLDGALAAGQSVANVWLARIAPGMALSLAIVDDKVTLDVSGAGGGHGYLAASAGERRRVSLALMLALAELAQSASEGPRGTLWFDEVFDVLDEDGVQAVCGALEALAQDRAVVVITHSPAVLEHLPAATRFHVSNGTVRCDSLKG